MNKFRYNSYTLPLYASLKKMNEVKIEVYHKKEKVTTTLYVEQLSECKFRMIDNDFCNPKLTLGTEFETEINEDKKHEITKSQRNRNSLYGGLD